MKDADEAAAAAMKVAEWFIQRGVPAYVIYHDEKGWHLAGPQHYGPMLAAGLRSLAEQCEAQLPAGPKSVN